MVSVWARGVRGRSSRVIIIRVASGAVACVFCKRQGAEELFVLGEIVNVMA